MRFLKHCHVLLETAHSDLSSGSGRRGGRLCPALWSLFPCALAGGNEEGADSVLLVAELWEVDWEGQG